MTKPGIGELIFFWMLFAGVGLLAFFILSPYISALFLAGVFAVVFQPAHERLQKIFRGKETLPALLIVLVVFFLILTPFIYLGIKLFQEIISIYGTLTAGSNIVVAVNHLLIIAEKYIQQFIPDFKMQANATVYLEQALRFAASNLNTFFSGLLAVIFQLFLIVVATFFLLRDGGKLRQFAIKWSPLPDKYDESIIAKVERAVTSVVKGALLTAMIQGFFVGVGFAIFGVPNPVLWGVVGTLCALIPLVGTGVVTIPAGAWLLYAQHPIAGVGLILWGVFCVGLIDNICRPFFLKRGVDVHPLLILLSVLGGLAYFGPVGFLAGPIILAFFFTLLNIYPEIIKGHRIDSGE